MVVSAEAGSQEASLAKTLQVSLISVRCYEMFEERRLLHNRNCIRVHLVLDDWWTGLMRNEPRASLKHLFIPAA